MLFTIGLPITKTKFLAETLESISKQSYKDFELIIRNNGASQEIKDEIKSACSSMLELPNVIYTESEKQLKMADNFNEIVKIANGKYITILSDDDILHPHFLEEFHKLINRCPGPDVFHCRVKNINQDGELIDYTELCPEFENLPDFLYHRLMGIRRIVLSDFIVSTKALQKIGGFPTFLKGWGVDTLTWYLLGNNGIAYTPEILLDYRINSYNFTNNRNNLLIKLEDLVTIKDQKEKMIRSGEFKKQSPYPADFMLKLNDKKFQINSKHIMWEICGANNPLRFLKLYRKYRRSHNLPGSYMYKLLHKKILRIGF